MNPSGLSDYDGSSQSMGISPKIVDPSNHKEAAMKRLSLATRQISLGLCALGLTGSLAKAEINYVGNQGFHQDNAGISRVYAEYGDEFGYALAIGDFNDDGYGDLAVGAPADVNSYGTSRYTGSVTILYGTAGGFRSAGNQILYGTRPGDLLRTCLGRRRFQRGRFR